MGRWFGPYDIYYIMYCLPEASCPRFRWKTWGASEPDSVSPPGVWICYLFSMCDLLGFFWNISIAFWGLFPEFVAEAHDRSDLRTEASNQIWSCVFQRNTAEECLCVVVFLQRRFRFHWGSHHHLVRRVRPIHVPQVPRSGGSQWPRALHPEPLRPGLARASLRPKEVPLFAGEGVN